ncbi:MAG: UDP-N-acetylmuramoyl-L-alanyl-D-glutamate--2,6-diaminopimelate ligase [Fimbriimonadaceae bacterium]|nr:UDP-N-acetylmuramoyl-L-alanyl-D-glutamate--2,6-diaminopimelate ligase [Fimbriimonadaceae bacterium]QYK59511.1 MAG: UDP-N-acetylmuramoyl-L-alanyl-D-glutamate--2,6-diaminopimelate ligase [Fimbriimonadaceae bacterium]
MNPKRLSEALDGAHVRHFADLGPDPWIQSVTADSRQVAPGALFVCMPSAQRDTHDFLPEAKEAGAVACVIHDAQALTVAQGLGLAVVGLTDEGQSFNFCLGRICRSLYDDPSASMRVVGVTGTNGKTTTAWMLKHALDELGCPAAYLGTLGLVTPSRSLELANTTPFPVELWGFIDTARADGAEALVMEASSHALFGRRLSGVSLDIGIFTNLTQDHLDYHGTMEAYEAAKKLLFTEYAAASGKEFASVLNMADPAARKWAPDLASPVFSYGAPGSMVEAVATDVKVDGLTLVSNGAEARLRFGGRYNGENARAALAGLVALGWGTEEALDSLATVPPVPGRFEAVPNDHGIGVLVDYAHTPDALTSLLRSVKDLQPRRVITVFGCGGDRDRGKRPLMAAAAAELSDLCVVTSDNPRTEDPETIIDEVVAGIPNGTEHHRVADRKEAIRWALNEARPGDVVVIAGKGHEDYQIIGREKFPMSDREMASEALGSLVSNG